MPSTRLPATGSKERSEMAAITTYLHAGRDVVVLQWPAQQAEAERLASRAVPLLLLVAPGAAPPQAANCVEDWVRLPADDADVRARVDALARRARWHPPVPEFDACGGLSFGGGHVFLSPTDVRVAQPLVTKFGHGVADEELLLHAWPGGATGVQLRVHVSRLRKRIAPLGLEITAIRGHGYRLHVREPAPRS